MLAATETNAKRIKSILPSVLSRWDCSMSCGMRAVMFCNMLIALQPLLMAPSSLGSSIVSSSISRRYSLSSTDFSGSFFCCSGLRCPGGTSGAFLGLAADANSFKSPMAAS